MLLLLLMCLPVCLPACLCLCVCVRVQDALAELEATKKELGSAHQQLIGTAPDRPPQLKRLTTSAAHPHIMTAAGPQDGAAASRSASRSAAASASNSRRQSMEQGALLTALNTAKQR
jgi:hypothetical protein